MLATIRFEVSWIQSLPGNKMSPLTISPNIHPTDQMSTGRWGGGGRGRGEEERGRKGERGGREGREEGREGGREGGRERVEGYPGMFTCQNRHILECLS